MIYQLSAISYQRSVVSYLSFPRKLESSSLTSSLSGLTGQSRTKVLDSPIKHALEVINRGSGNDRKKLRRNDYNFTVFNSSEAGFSLVELMITMVVFVLVIAAASQVFTGLLTQFKQQSKIAETNIEGIVGLEMMRRDIEHAGYGLPWVIPAGVTYEEASAAEAAVYNDSTTNPPRAILSGNNIDFASPNNPFDDSDYLVIKAVNVARNATAQRWTRLRVGNDKRNGLSGDNFDNDDRVIVISPGSTDTNRMALAAYSSGGTTYWHTTYDATTNFAPSDATETRIIYGINNPADDSPPPPPPRMPFNRADYYIWRDSMDPATDEVPDRCALYTGILRKAVISHVNGDRSGVLPLLDCVADMQVVFGLDTTTTPDGAVDCYVNNLANSITVNAENIRNRVREVRVYILAHEGQYDRDFTYATNLVRVGEDLPRCAPGAADETVLGRNRDLSNPLITNWQNYRWKVYTIVVKPNNLR